VFAFLLSDLATAQFIGAGSTRAASHFQFIHRPQALVQHPAARQGHCMPCAAACGGRMHISCRAGCLHVLAAGLAAQQCQAAHRLACVHARAARAAVRLVVRLPGSHLKKLERGAGAPAAMLTCFTQGGAWLYAGSAPVHCGARTHIPGCAVGPVCPAAPQKRPSRHVRFVWPLQPLRPPTLRMP
jgi:hypothetical protein